MHTAIIKALEERQRQITEEGFTAEHDDHYPPGALAAAAAAYAAVAEDILQGGKSALDDMPPAFWPWDEAWYKPSPDPKRNIIKAMALLSAEYDRIERAEVPAQASEPEKRYTTDDEWQLNIYEDLSELIQDRERQAGDVIYAGVKKNALATDFTTNLHESVIEGMQLQAEDEAGEAGEDFPDCSEPQEQTLQALIDAWATRYFTPDFYTVVNAAPYTITDSDIQAAQECARS